jgi:hypothetical protein
MMISMYLSICMESVLSALPTERPFLRPLPDLLVELEVAGYLLELARTLLYRGLG